MRHPSAAASVKDQFRWVRYSIHLHPLRLQDLRFSLDQSFSDQFRPMAISPRDEYDIVVGNGYFALGLPPQAPLSWNGTELAEGCRIRNPDFSGKTDWKSLLQNSTGTPKQRSPMITIPKTFRWDQGNMDCGIAASGSRDFPSQAALGVP